MSAQTNRPKAATMSDVARLAGVSLKTVSRVFNKEKYVSEDKKTKVLEVAASLNYSPAVAARGLAGGRSFMIGLFVDEASGDYVSKVMRGLVNACEQAGNHLVVEVLREQRDTAKLRRTLASVRFDGVVLPPPLCDARPVLDVLKESGIPTARIGPGFKCDDFASVAIDDRRAAEDMTHYLIAAGHRRIGFIQGHPDHAAANEREAGFRAAMAGAGLEVDEALITQGYFSFDTGQAAARHLLSQPNRPTAIFAANDEMAAGVIDIAHTRGLRIPGDLSVVGFDDDVLASITVPALTTVHQPVEEMARVAHQLVTEAADSGADRHSVFPFDLKKRQSVQGC